MADYFDSAGKAVMSRLATGQQKYFVDVLGPANGRALSVVSFVATERMGEPYDIRVELTHRDELSRSDYLNREATFIIDSGDGSPPIKFSGYISTFSKLKTTKDFRSYRIRIRSHIARLPRVWPNT